MSPPPITAEEYGDPFRYLDAKVEEFKTQKRNTAAALKACGWTLRPNHPVTMVWRALRWTKKAGSQRLSAPTPAELIHLVQDEYEPRRLKKELAAKHREEAKRAKDQRRLAREAKRREHVR